MRLRGLRPPAVGLILALALTGCGLLPARDDEPTPTTAATTRITEPFNLRGACPNPVVIQTDWNPEAEYAASYNLVGKGSKVDVKRETVRGPLVVEGRATGVDVEVRTGGPVIDFDSVAHRMYVDREITLGLMNNEQEAQLWSKWPMTSVVAPLDISPGMIMWDPEVHPEWNTIVDIGQTDEKVLVTGDDLFPEFLIGSGILRKDQVDPSYDGSPTRFLDSKGEVAQGGFATAEPWLYEYATKGFDRPVSYQLIHDSGFQSYTQTLAIRAGDKARLAPCLRKLVPLIQRSIADYITKPDRANQLIVDLVNLYSNGWIYPPELAQFSVAQQNELGLVGNGSDRTVGNFDMTRVRGVLDIVRTIFASRKEPLPAELSAEDLATNDFIDPSIGLR
jgi:hypothetical protein